MSNEIASQSTNSPHLTETAVIRKDGRCITTSLIVAEVFDKQHKDVLRAIRSLGCSEEFNRRNFALVKYKDDKGEMRPMYEMTRDGWTMLVMGFTGKLAFQFKEAYINLFNAMEHRPGDCHYTYKQIKGYRGRIKTLQMTLLDQVPEYRNLRRYLMAGLKWTEIAKLLDCSVKTTKRKAQKLADCGLFEYPSQNKIGETIGRDYPKANKLEVQP